MIKKRYLMLRLLRRLGAGRRTSKTLHKVAGQLSRIKTPHRMYQWIGPGMPSKPAGWRWLPCNPSMWLLNLSQQLDWDHWDHWACVHDECDRPVCAECGGIACPTAEDFAEWDEQAAEL